MFQIPTTAENTVMIAPSFLTPTQAHEAFEAIVLPGILNAMENWHVKRPHLHVVVVDPTIAYGHPAAETPFLFQHSIGRDDWADDYQRYAQAKARLSWRTGLSSREVVLTKPHLLLPGNTHFWGSAIVGGIITACSGVESYWDEAFAGMTSAALCGEASYNAAQYMKRDDAPDFLPRHP
jgi:hypothetical protein